MNIEQRQQEIIDQFADMDEWLDRYAYIIDLGRELPQIDEKLKTPQHKIEGCQSSVWIDARLDENGRIHFTADADALIVKGIISMILQVLNDSTPQEILDANLHFIDDIGLSENLSPTRSNGVLAMLKQIRMYALAFKAIQTSKDKQ